MYIRKIPVSSEIEDIRSQLRRCARIPLKDLKIMQPLPNCEFKGKWKFMTCEGPATAIQMLTQACLKRTLPWKMNSAPPTHPGAIFRQSKNQPSPGPRSKTRNLIQPLQPSPQHPHPHPSFLPIIYSSFVKDHPPPSSPSNPTPNQATGSACPPPLMGLWHQLQAQGRKLANLQLRRGAPTLHTPPLNWGQVAW